jgi:ABC-2 type transport system permease protein
LGEFIQETLALNQASIHSIKAASFYLNCRNCSAFNVAILFGALFQNAPQTYLEKVFLMGKFLGAGVLVFTVFAGALNAGFARDV